MSTTALILATEPSHGSNCSLQPVSITRPGIAASRLLLTLALGATTYFTTTDLTHTAAAEEINDKLAHVISFLVLAKLADLSFPQRRYDWAVWTPLLFYGLAIEIIQYHLPYRSFSLLDMVADAGGLLVYWLIIKLWQHSVGNK